MNKLRSVNEIDFPYCQVFKEFENFNWIQSAVFDDLKTKKSMVISAPTGAGKTVICELAIINLLIQLKETGGNVKVIYVAPVKALCSEKFNEWSQKFEPLDLKCLELTGDSEIINFNDVLSANIIVTTPEKWDSITRRWREYQEFLRKIGLFLIDEVHLLNEDIRGPILEAIVSRMKTVNNSLKPVNNNDSRKASLRFIAVSATIPNIEDMTTWLGGHMDCIQHQFSDDQRPVKLDKFILGYPTNLPSFRFDIHLNYRLSEVIRQYSNQKPTLIFCSSRKSVEMASAVLQKQNFLFQFSDSQKSSLVSLSNKLQNLKLSKLVVQGIAFHHAGLTYHDRNNIEEAFRCGLIMALISTNTLALGVNLPAHLVIIKSTETFIRGAIVEYTESQILQMIGRAGRPQYDNTGVAVIMTQRKNVKKYENLMNGSTPVESHLHKHLVEHLNSEIVLQTITDLEIAMEWIRSTFLYVRAVKCPINYGFAQFMTREKVEKKLEEICLTEINSLEEYGLVEKDQTSQMTVRATPYGRLMSRYYISFDTMKIFRKIRGNESFLEIFNTIICCKEFSEFMLRVNEKKALNEINNLPVRFPIQGKIKTRDNKTSCLIQAVFGNLHIADSYLVQESLKMLRLGERVSKCFLEYVRLLQNEKNGIGMFKAMHHAAIVAKCFRSKLWENSSYVVKQVKKIGEAYSKLLVNSGKTTIKSIVDTNPRILERILNKQPPFGDEIIEALQLFPVYNIEMNLIDENSIQIRISQINSKHIYDKNNAIIVVGDTENNLLLYCDKVDVTIQDSGVFKRTVIIRDKNVNAIWAHLVHEDLVGVDVSSSLVLNPLKETVTEKQPKKRQKTKKSGSINLATELTNAKISKNIVAPEYNTECLDMFDSEQSVESGYHSKLRSFKLCKSKIKCANKTDGNRDQAQKQDISLRIINNPNPLNTSRTAMIPENLEQPANEKDPAFKTGTTNLPKSSAMNEDFVNDMMDFEEYLRENEAEKKALEQDPLLYERETFIYDEIGTDIDMSLFNMNELLPLSPKRRKTIKEEPVLPSEDLGVLVTHKAYKQSKLSQFYKSSKTANKLIQKKNFKLKLNPQMETPENRQTIQERENIYLNPPGNPIVKILPSDVWTRKVIKDCNESLATPSCESYHKNKNKACEKMSTPLNMSHFKTAIMATKPKSNLTLNSTRKSLEVSRMPGSLLLRKADPFKNIVETTSDTTLFKDSYIDLNIQDTKNIQTNPMDLSTNKSISWCAASHFSTTDHNLMQINDDGPYLKCEAKEVFQGNTSTSILKENIFRARNRSLICFENSKLLQSKNYTENSPYPNQLHQLRAKSPSTVKSSTGFSMGEDETNNIIPKAPTLGSNYQLEKTEICLSTLPTQIDHSSDIIQLQIKLLIEMAKAYKNPAEIDDKIAKIRAILQGSGENPMSKCQLSTMHSKNLYSSPSNRPNDSFSSVIDLSTSKRQLKSPEPLSKKSRLDMTVVNNPYRLRLKKSPDSNLTIPEDRKLAVQQINSQLMAEVMQRKCFEYKDIGFVGTTNTTTITKTATNTIGFFEEHSKFNTPTSTNPQVVKSQSPDILTVKSSPDTYAGAEERIKEEFSNLFSQNLENLNEFFGISFSN